MTMHFLKQRPETYGPTQAEATLSLGRRLMILAAAVVTATIIAVLASPVSPLGSYARPFGIATVFLLPAVASIVALRASRRIG